MTDDTFVSHRNHSVAEQSKNYRYSSNHQFVIDTGSRLVVVVGRPLPGIATTVRRGRYPGLQPQIVILLGCGLAARAPARWG